MVVYIASWKIFGVLFESLLGHCYLLLIRKFVFAAANLHCMKESNVDQSQRIMVLHPKKG